MARPIPDRDLRAIEAVVGRHPQGIGAGNLARELGQQLSRRTLQYRLKYLVDRQRLVREGDRRWASYRLPEHDPAGTREDRGTYVVGGPVVLETHDLVDDTGRAVLELIRRYAETWRLLLEYDEDRLELPSDKKPSVGVLDHERATRAIGELKRDLTTRKEASSLFGNPRDGMLQAILGSIEQTMFSEPLYGSAQEKAAHLLYFIIKDHPFTDGNKRIGSFLFMLYLQQQGLTHKLNPAGLTALTLLIAGSAPSSKDLMIRLIVNLLD